MRIMDVFSKALEVDPEGAAQLADHVAFSVAVELVEANRPQLERMVLADAGRRIVMAKAALGREYVSKTASGQYPGPDVLEFAAWLSAAEQYAAVVKADTNEQWTINGHVVQRRVLRDNFGRFARVSSTPSSVTNSRIDMVPEPSRPVKAKLVEDNGMYRPAEGEKAERLDAFEGSAQAALQRAQAWSDSLGSSASAAQVEFRFKDGTRKRVNLAGLLNEGDWGGVTARSPIEAMRLVPETDVSDKATMDSIDRVGGGLNLLGRVLKNPRVLSPVEPKSRVERLLRQVGVAGEVIGEISPDAKVARMAELVGAFGPEAARVLEPHVRRAAYRYRGTERTPDKAILADFTGARKKDLEAFADLVESDGAGLAAMGVDAAKHRDDPMFQAMKVRGERDPQASPDSILMGVRSDLATAELVKTLPRKSLVAELSAKSGHVLPSQGVLIDADGDVVSQSVGFSDDHYLPFNLTNLGRLRGGQYVRTRQQGGLTGEDIYTSVFYGARSATVASSSGVFRLEFEPDFRGARAGSDKAWSMYDRYLKILQSVEGSGMYMIDLPGSEKEQIKQKVRTEFKNRGKSDKDLVKEFEAAFQEARNKKRGEIDQTFMDKLKTDIADEVKQELPQATDQRRAREVEDRFAERLQEERDKRIQQLNLNGRGYELALLTLQQQFPYFIRKVEYEPLVGKNDKDAFGRDARFSYGRPGMGFFAARGISTQVAPRPSSAADQGFVGRGSLTRAEYKRSRNASEEAAAEEAPAAGGTGGGTVGAPKPAERPQTGVSSTPEVAATSSAPAKQARMKATLEVETRDRMIKGIRNALNSVVNKPIMVDGQPAGTGRDISIEDERLKRTGVNHLLLGMKSFDDAGSAKEQLLFLLNSPEKKMTELFEQHPQAILEALSTEGALESALNDLWPGKGVAEAVEQYQLMGTTDKDEFLSRLTQAATAVVDWELAAEPFAPESEIATSTGKAIEFGDIVSLTDRDKLEAFAAANPKIAAAAEALGWSDGKPLRMVDVSARMGKAREALTMLKDGLDVEDASVEAVLTSVARRHGNALNADVLAPLGVESQKAFLDSLSGKSPDAVKSTLDEMWVDLQRGRALLEVNRIYDVNSAVAEGKGEVGLAGPKARPAWIRKGLRRRGSDPVAKAVAARRVRDFAARMEQVDKVYARL